MILMLNISSNERYKNSSSLLNKRYIILYQHNSYLSGMKQDSSLLIGFFMFFKFNFKYFIENFCVYVVQKDWPKILIFILYFFWFNIKTLLDLWKEFESVSLNITQICTLQNTIITSLTSYVQVLQWYNVLVLINHFLHGGHTQSLKMWVNSNLTQCDF